MIEKIKSRHLTFGKTTKRSVIFNTHVKINLMIARQVQDFSM